MKIRIKWKIKINFNSIIFALSMIVMLYSFLPVTASVLTATAMLAILIVLYIMILLCSNWKRNQVIICNMLLGLTAVIIFFVKEFYKDGIIGLYTILLYFFPAFLGIYLFNSGMFRHLKILAMSVMFLMVITGITTFAALGLYPELARDLAAFNSDNIIRLSTMYNVGGYDFTYCVVLSIPIFCLLVVKKIPTILARIIEILIFAISIIFIIKTQYTTALLLGIVSFVMIIIIRKFDLKRLCILVIFSLFLLSAFKGEIAHGLSNMASNIESHSISQRLNEMSKVFEGGSLTGEDMTERGNAYRKSLDAFTEHPLLGMWIIGDNMDKIGGHSTIFDLLASAGIILFILVIYTFYYVEKSMLSKIEDEITKKYVGIFLLIYIILAFVNPIINVTFFSMLCIVLPGVALMKYK